MMDFQIINRIFPKEGFGRNTALLAGSTAFGQGLGILIIPLLTRLYHPEDFGIVALYASSLSILLVVSSMRYEWAIPIAVDEETAISLLSLCLLILAAFTAVLGLGIWWAQQGLKGWGYISPIQPYAWLLVVGIVFAGAYQVLNAWAVRYRDFGTLAKTKMTQSVSAAIVQVGFGFLKGGPFGLLLGNLLSQAAGVETLALLLWRRHQRALRAITTVGIRYVAHRYYKFPLFSMGSSLLNTAGLQLMPILMAAFYGPTVVGWFALSQQVIGIPRAFIGSATAQTFWGEASNLIHKDPKKLENLFYRLAKRLMVLSLPIVVIGMAGPSVFEWVLGGERWKMAGKYALYLTPMFVTQFVASTVSHLIVHELQNWQLLWDSGRLILVGMCISMGNVLGWSADETIILYSVTMSLMYVALFVMNGYALRLKIKGKAQE